MKNKLDDIKTYLETIFNGKVKYKEATDTLRPQYIFSLKLKYSTYIYLYSVDMEAIAQSEPLDIAQELEREFLVLIYAMIRRD